eukprot:TRINITY_DN67819_c0_g1_i1.p1 TRINITY_DN67819_c0_g1~~TRINITY_DN67819_c0_g1_i1.p1  ORF type:complete len:164 (-),score=32.28 TRINITY_DN67819_c0_g1_i1:32-523(-)
MAAAEDVGALKVFLEQLQPSALFGEVGPVLRELLSQRQPRVWIQGYVICREGDDVVDVDDGSAVRMRSRRFDVMSLDIVPILARQPQADAVLRTGRYLSCVCALALQPEEALIDLRLESVTDLSRPEHGLAEPFWWLEVAEAHERRAARLAESATQCGHSSDV